MQKSILSPVLIVGLRDHHGELRPRVSSAFPIPIAVNWLAGGRIRWLSQSR
jgi:hypothetical protein